MAQVRTYRKLLANVSGGSVDMNVDGSSTDVVFHQQASNRGQVVTIDEVRFVFRSTGMDLSTTEVQNFGAVGAALTTGLLFQADIGDNNINLFSEVVTRMSDLWRYCEEDVVNMVDGYPSNVDLAVFRWVPTRPLVLTWNQRAQTTADRITVTVQDDLTSLDHFQVQVIGEERL
ncbi:MAG: hypothetical protein GY913_21545 [Proteobacteria bacterium]|nr:hypothetical protein [Actinomycetes bacterium]MCP4919494.1 hypothetical protein [Pseudomonadota bacterium]